jgi:hypothetical protein
MRHDLGLAASPLVRYRLKMEGSACPPFSLPLVLDRQRNADPAPWLAAGF